MDIVTADPIVDSAALTDTAPAPEEGGSLADHESEFNQPGRVSDGPLNPDADPEESLTRDESSAIDKTGKFARHRAGSQKATAEDVQQINALTKELRATETDWLKANPDAVKDSPRITALKRQLRGMKADLEAVSPKAAPTQPTSTPVVAATEFTEKPPVFEDFATEADPLVSFMDARARWIWKQEQHQQQEVQQATRLQAEDDQLRTTALQSIAAFKASRPDFDTVTASFVTRHLPPVLLNAILRHDNRPQFMYHLGQHQELADELVFLTHGKELSDDFVAFVQRRLTKELGQIQAAPTRSAVPAKALVSPPPPPNLVRTGPIKSEDDLPSDESSLAEHERAFTRRRR